MATFSPTDLQYVIPEIWQGRVIYEILKEKLLGMHLFEDLSDLFSEGGDVAYLPNFIGQSFTANDKSNNATTTLQSIAPGRKSITVDTWKEVTFLIEDKEAVQVLRELRFQEIAMDMAVYAVAATFDTSLMSLYTGLTKTVGDSASNLSDARIREALTYMEENNVPAEDRYWLLRPAVFFEDILGVSKYYEPGAFPRGASPITTGELNKRLEGSVPKAVADAYKGDLYGDPVFITTQVVKASSAYYNLYVQKRAFAFAIQTPGAGKNVRTQSWYDKDYLGTRVTCDMIYGVATMQPTFGVILMAETAGSIVS